MNRRGKEKAVKNPAPWKGGGGGGGGGLALKRKRSKRDDQKTYVQKADEPLGKKGGRRPHNHKARTGQSDRTSQIKKG